ncbi:P-loop NTPase fold protein [Stenotrophomonas sp. RAC2]|uniref:KAP family P-loop NTPase fold protein n=1 Tax=Stenotrophomonas sp. RAC2 TaxID=3064902 RepID=UPI0027235AF6|nr:P-loop NTPase fold protein [Stenotrophomonas sp. RAC2]MDV9042036.1 P-loop NTPase fold protein [Stenotrophomonas sp. RAC2]
MPRKLIRASQVDVKRGSPWENDIFDRKRAGEMLCNLILSLDQPFVIAINGGWGSGKTVFLRRLGEHLKTQTPRSHSVYLDAWSTDWHDDPLLALVLAVNETLAAAGYVKSGELGRKVVGNAAQLAAPTAMITAHLLAPGTGPIAGAVAKAGAEAIKSASDRARAKRGLEDSLKEARDLLLQRQSGRPISGQVVVIIDELDRCRPDYAIRMLERIKHLFHIAGYVFVIATDNVNLRGAVKTVYGHETDGEQYLRKFFDFEMHLRRPDPLQFTKALIEQFEILPRNWMESPKWRSLELKNFHLSEPLDSEEQWLEAISEYCRCSEKFSLSLRDQAQAFSLLNAMMLTHRDRQAFLPPVAAFLSCLRFGHERAFDLIKTGGIDSLRKVAADHQRYGVPSDYLLTLCRLLERPENRWAETLTSLQAETSTSNFAERISARLGAANEWSKLPIMLNDIIFMVNDTIQN